MFNCVHETNFEPRKILKFYITINFVAVYFKNIVAVLLYHCVRKQFIKCAFILLKSVAEKQGRKQLRDFEKKKLVHRDSLKSAIFRLLGHL